ncbi:MAG: ABC transporter [Spirochaetae bacterium HGW-Spirochaetae-1]|jgi:ABC-2 type transport system ATP-binding protein|nr:MAG: ABC transporter [Spirochaetae bacterium HGW-Spirochaetae-1]
MISANELTRYYGDFKAVNNISFTIRDGEITGLLGPNGAGKTTTLRMLTCFLKPSGGNIVVDNYRIDEEPLKIKEIIGYLPESAPLYGDMIVYDYLQYVAQLRNVQDSGRIREIGELCGIGEVMHKNINELSKGYRQRVGLAQAMIHDPKILVLDEPTSGLDPNQIIEIRKLIKEIGKKKTVILSTHILSEVEATCDRVIIINQGSIVADDRTENLQAAKGSKTVTVKVKGADFEALSGSLASLPGVEKVTNLGDGELTAASVTVEGSHDARPHIYDAIKSRDWTLYEMKQEQRSLEHIFRELTIGGSDE